MKTENPLSSSTSRRCPECGSCRIMKDHESAEIVCMACGYVVAAKLTDQGPEWRAFDDEQRAKRARAGAPTTFTIHDKGLSTTIDWHDRDIHGQRIPQGQKAQIYRLRKWQRRIRVYNEAARGVAPHPGHDDGADDAGGPGAEGAQKKAAGGGSDDAGQTLDRGGHP